MLTVIEQFIDLLFCIISYGVNVYIGGQRILCEIQCSGCKSVKDQYPISINDFILLKCSLYKIVCMLWKFKLLWRVAYFAISTYLSSGKSQSYCSTFWLNWMLNTTRYQIQRQRERESHNINHELIKLFQEWTYERKLQLI